MKIEDLCPTDEEVLAKAFELSDTYDLYHSSYSTDERRKHVEIELAKYAVDNAVKKIVEYLGNDRGFGLVKKVQALKELIK